MKKIKNTIENLYNRFLIIKYAFKRKHLVLIDFNRDFSKVDVISVTNNISIETFAENIMSSIDVNHKNINV